MQFLKSNFQFWLVLISMFSCGRDPRSERDLSERSQETAVEEAVGFDFTTISTGNVYLNKWPKTDITVSFIPDGTSFSYGGVSPSKLFSVLNAVAPKDQWQHQMMRALQVWADVTPINFHVVKDDGRPSQAQGYEQGDPGVGDIRIGMSNLAYGLASTLGSSFHPEQGYMGGTGAGDITLNSSVRWGIGSNIDIFSVVVHEVGHALGLGHSELGTVMYPTYNGIKSGLSADDIKGVRSLYGSRKPDAYDAISSNDSVATATSINLSDGGAMLKADISSKADRDYYRVLSDGPVLTATVDAKGLSFLNPKVSVLTEDGTIIGSKSAGEVAGTASVTVRGLSKGKTYIVSADGAGSGIFSLGAYVLNLQFSDQ